MFQIFEEVIYPAYGVARITREIVKEINGEIISFYELKFLTKDVTILIPHNNMKIAGVRYLSSKDDMMEAFKILESSASEDFLERIILVSWNRRSKEYQNKIKEGNIKDLALIYHDLRYLEAIKGLSFAEKNILKQVECLLSEECMYINGGDLNDNLLLLRQKTINEKITKKKIKERIDLDMIN